MLCFVWGLWFFCSDPSSRLSAVGHGTRRWKFLMRSLCNVTLKMQMLMEAMIPRCLLAERDAARPNSPLTSRLIQRANALHA